MKFKELRRLIEQYDILEGHGIAVPGYNSQQAADGSVGLHDLSEPEMLERINAFVQPFLSNVPSAGMLDPRQKLIQLRVELNKIGLDFKYDGKKYPTSEHMEFKLTQFGGRTGVDEKGTKLDDDGLTHKLGHGLKLVIDMSHPEDVGQHTLQGKIVSGDAGETTTYEGGSEAASTFKK